MIQAAPLVLSFARAVPMLNKLIGAVGITELGNRVNNYIQENPEESEKIISMIMPAQGIANALKNKSSEEEKISLEDLEDMSDEEAQDLSQEDKAELMKQAGKKRNRELSIATSEKIGLSGPGKEKQDIEYEIDERYDEGGVEQKKGYDFRDYIPKGAYRRRKADGGAIGIEVLFEEKNPRQGLFMGGPALDGQALSIYNSMNAYGFTDQEIANALQEQGYYTPPGSTPDPTPDQGIINQQLNQGGGDGPKGDFGKFGNLLKDTEKTFTKDVYAIDKNMYPGAPMTGSFKPTEITGYQDVTSGLYKTEDGKNINHLGLNIKPGIVSLIEKLGFSGLDETELTGLPYKEGYIAGTFTGKKLSDFFKTQQATNAEIAAANLKAKQELDAKLAAEKAAKEAAIAAEMAKYNITSDSDFGDGTPGGGGGNVSTTGGDVYGGSAYGYNEAAEKTDYYRDGGLATMFKEKK